MLLRWELHIAPGGHEQFLENSSFIIQVDTYIAAPELEYLINELSREPVFVAAFAADPVAYQVVPDFILRKLQQRQKALLVGTHQSA